MLFLVGAHWPTLTSANALPPCGSGVYTHESVGLGISVERLQSKEPMPRCGNCVVNAKKRLEGDSTPFNRRPVVGHTIQNEQALGSAAEGSRRKNGLQVKPLRNRANSVFRMVLFGSFICVPSKAVLS